MVKALGFNQTKQEIQDLFEKIDDDKSGMIEYNEFMGMVQRDLVAAAHQMRDRNMGTDLEETFKHFSEVDLEARDDDDDDFNFIDVDKLIVVAANLDIDLSREKAKQMIQVADGNGDGKVELTDFLKIMKRMKLF